MSSLNAIQDANEWNSLREQLVSLCFKETMTKLEIFQRGLRLNASVTLPPNSTTTVMKKKAAIKDKSFSNMPDEKLLNAIKFDKELDTLLMVLAAAGEASNVVEGRNGNDDDEIESSMAVKTLQQTITALKDTDNEVDRKMRELREKQAKLESLKGQMESEQIEQMKRHHRMDERIATLRHNLRNIRRLNDLEFELVERWEANRYTQASILYANEERLVQMEIEEFDRHLFAERRVRAAIEKFNSKQFEEFRVKIAEWKTKYANEMAKVTAETREHEKRIMELKKIRERHEQTYAERIAFVRDYLEQKAEQQRLYEQQMHRVECAVRLQAWWRGVMVRRGLGPYRKKAKKGKKGKAKGK